MAVVLIGATAYIPQEKVRATNIGKAEFKVK
jgi:hypothetical protein